MDNLYDAICALNIFNDSDGEEPCNLESIDSQLKALDKQIMDMAKLNNINPALLLSPGTDQMCTMASGLALSSPKMSSYSDNSLLIVSASEPSLLTESSGDMEYSDNPNEKKRKLYPVFVKDEVKAKQARFEGKLIFCCYHCTKFKTHRISTVYKFYSIIFLLF